MQAALELCSRFAGKILQRCSIAFSVISHQLPTLDEFSSPDLPPCGLAFDHLRLSPSTLRLTSVSRLSPLLRAAFAEELGQLEARRAKLLGVVVEDMAEKVAAAAEVDFEEEESATVAKKLKTHL